MHSDTKWILQQTAIGAALAAYFLAGTAIIIAARADPPPYSWNAPATTAR